MMTSNEFNNFEKKVQAERMVCSMQLKTLEDAETRFKKFTNEKRVLRAKIETLEKIESWLDEDLRKDILLKVLTEKVEL